MDYSTFFVSVAFYFVMATGSIFSTTPPRRTIFNLCAPSAHTPYRNNYHTWDASEFPSRRSPMNAINKYTHLSQPVDNLFKEKDWTLEKGVRAVRAVRL